MFALVEHVAERGAPVPASWSHAIAERDPALPLLGMCFPAPGGWVRSIVQGKKVKVFGDVDKFLLREHAEDFAERDDDMIMELGQCPDYAPRLFDILRVESLMAAMLTPEDQLFYCRPGFIHLMRSPQPGYPNVLHTETPTWYVRPYRVNGD